MRFEPYDIVAAPFPYVERPITKRRPCLVVGDPDDANIVWVMMITSTKNDAWKNDIDIPETEESGLKAKSVIRTAKIATVESNILKYVGRLDEETQCKVRKKLEMHLQPV